MADLSEMRLAMRMLARRPGFTTVAVLTLVLGIGANTAVFSVANALLARPWPGVAEPSRLVWVTERLQGRTLRLSYPEVREYAERVEALAGVAGFDRIAVNLSYAGWSERESAQVVTAGYFDVLGVRPFLGRLLGAADGDRAAVAVLSYRCWRERFAADPAVVGREVTANGRQLTVIGVALPGFDGLELEERPALWTPVGALRPSWLSSRDSAWLSAVARLRDGAGLAQAGAAVAAVCASQASQRSADRAGLTAEVSRAHGWLAPGQGADAAAPVVLGLGATGLVLLIAAANFANLLLVRAAARGRELAVRATLGATRWQVARLLLAESLLVAVLGGAGGLLLAAWGTPVLAARVGAPANLAPVADLSVAAYAFAVALAVGLAFGLVPARAAWRRDLALPLRTDARAGGADRGRTRLHSRLVVGQIALSLVLLAVAALLLRSLARAASADVGIDRDRSADVVALSFDVTAQGIGGDARNAFRRELLARARALPGVRSAALAETLPLGGRAVGMEARPAGADSGGSMVFRDAVSPGYFGTLGIPLVAGRDLADGDRPGTAPVAVVNEALAARFWPGRSPLGESVVLDDPPVAHQVVGVVRDGAYMHVGEAPRPILYVSLLQSEPVLPDATLVAWSATPSATLLRLRDELRALDPRLPVFDVRTLDAVLAANLSDRRLGSILVACFGALALLLAVVGAAGVLAHAVGERTREIGTRLALGATGATVARQFLAYGVRLGLTGAAIGTPMALAAGVLMRSLLLGAGIADFAAIGGVAALLTAMVAAASAVPAWRASRVDPIESLRYE